MDANSQMKSQSARGGDDGKHESQRGGQSPSGRYCSQAHGVVLDDVSSQPHQNGGGAGRGQ